MSLLYFAFFTLLVVDRIVHVKAWGKDGHEVVANIAYNLLTEATKEAAYNILFPSDDFNATEHQSPLAAVANWADKVRYTKTFAWTTPLHYVDVKDKLIQGGCPVTPSPERNDPEKRFDSFDAESNCTVVYNRDCNNDHCAIGAIFDFYHLSKYPRDSESVEKNVLRGSVSHHDDYNVTQRESLMFLIHIIGDVHQPLHVSRETDRGGNTIHVSFPEDFFGFRDERFGHYHSGWNLHSVWDVAIIQRSIGLFHNSSQFAFQTSIEDELITSNNIASWLSCPHKSLNGVSLSCIMKWAEESFSDALLYAYANEHGMQIVNGEVLTEAYFRSRLDVVRKRLAAGGVRLAMALENIFSSASLGVGMTSAS